VPCPCHLSNRRGSLPSLGHPLVDRYLDLVAGRVRSNTMRAGCLRSDVVLQRGSRRIGLWETGSRSTLRRGGTSPDHRHSSPHVPTIAGHGLHFDSGGSEELADLGRRAQGRAAACCRQSRRTACRGIDGLQGVGRAAVSSVSRVKRSAYPSAAVVDVTEEFRPW